MNAKKRPRFTTKAGWAAAQVAAVRRQLADADQIETGSDWRRRRSKAQLMGRLRAQEARFVRLAEAPASAEDLPF